MPPRISTHLKDALSQPNRMMGEAQVFSQRVRLLKLPPALIAHVCVAALQTNVTEGGGVGGGVGAGGPGVTGQAH